MRGAAHFSTRPTTRASIESITRDDLLAFHARHYHPGSFIFAVSGDVTPGRHPLEAERAPGRLAGGRRGGARRARAGGPAAPGAVRRGQAGRQPGPGVDRASGHHARQSRSLPADRHERHPGRRGIQLAAAHAHPLRRGAGLQRRVELRHGDLLRRPLPRRLPVAQRDRGAGGGHRARGDRAHPFRAGDGRGAAELDCLVRRDLHAQLLERRGDGRTLCPRRVHGPRPGVPHPLPRADQRGDRRRRAAGGPRVSPSRSG